MVSSFVYCAGDPGGLHSFPTRRSSDLTLGILPSHAEAPPRAEAARATGSNRGSQTRSQPAPTRAAPPIRSEEHTSELQSRRDLVCRLLLEKKNLTISRMSGKPRLGGKS